MAQSARIRTPVLDVAYEASGPADGLPVLLLHGFPYDVRSFDGVVARVNAAGFRTIVPWLRGYGGTRFLSADTLRSGEQAALGQDLLELLDALRIQKAVLAGYDWGGRAACVVSALWPERVAGLVSCTGYNIQDIANSRRPADPAQEARLWYQYYFHTERGRNGLTEKRREISRLLWKMWSPNWAFDDATFDRTAGSFDNRGFCRCGNSFVPASDRQRRRRSALRGGGSAVGRAARHRCSAINLHGAADGVMPARGVGRPRQTFHRGLSAPRSGECRPQCAAGGAAGLCRRDPAAMQGRIG